MEGFDIDPFMMLESECELLVNERHTNPFQKKRRYGGL